MTVSKNSVAEVEPYCDEFEWEDFLFVVGTMIKARFKTGYVKCQAENMGWQRRSGYKVFTCDINKPAREVAREFLFSFMPNTDWCATVYSLNRGSGLYFSVSHHDAQGESYYLTPITERTYERLR